MWMYWRGNLAREVEKTVKILCDKLDMSIEKQNGEKDINKITSKFKSFLSGQLVLIHKRAISCPKAHVSILCKELIMTKNVTQKTCPSFYFRHFYVASPPHSFMKQRHIDVTYTYFIQKCMYIASLVMFLFHLRQALYYKI